MDWHWCDVFFVQRVRVLVLNFYIWSKFVMGHVARHRWSQCGIIIITACRWRCRRLENEKEIITRKMCLFSKSKERCLDERCCRWQRDRACVSNVTNVFIFEWVQRVMSVVFSKGDVGKRSLALIGKRGYLHFSWFSCVTKWFDLTFFLMTQLFGSVICFICFNVIFKKLPFQHW